jgi:Fe2+ transport system protein FeoA
MNLFDLSVGKSCKIVSVNVDSKAKERLYALNIKVGERATSLSFSTFKSTILVQCGPSRIAIRGEVARHIEVVPID